MLFYGVSGRTRKPAPRPAGTPNVDPRLVTTGKKRHAVDAAVIGAGVFGAWTALRLRGTGRSVVLVDAFGAGNTRSSSSGESRLLRFGYGRHALYSRWARYSARAWQEAFRDWDEDLFVRTGVLWMARPDDTALDETAKNLEELRVPFETLDRADMERRYPQFALGPVTRGLLEPTAGVILARRAVQSVVRQAVKRGVDYRIARILPPPAGAARVDALQTNTGDRIVAGAYVFAGGAWLPRIFPDVLGGLVHPTRQEVFFFGPDAGDRRFAPPSTPAWIDPSGGVYAVPDVDGRGYKIGLDRHGPAFDPTSRGDRTVSEDGLERARTVLARRIPALRHAPLIDSRVCAYSNSWNGDFLIDRHPDAANVWLVGAGSGHGFKHGPAVGDYAASRIAGLDGEEPRLTLAAHRPQWKRDIF